MDSGLLNRRLFMARKKISINDLYHIIKGEEEKIAAVLKKFEEKYFNLYLSRIRNNGTANKQRRAP
jgi:hypothetical protein